MIREKIGPILQNAVCKMKHRLLDMSISAKIMAYYLVLLIASVLLSGILYQQVLSGIISGKVSDVAIQMLHSISASFSSTIDIAGEYSKLVTTNEEIQDILKNGSRNSNFYNQFKSYTSTMRLIGGSPLIASVYMFDNYGNSYNAFKDQIKVMSIDHIDEADWFQEVKEKKGGFVIKLNAGGIFKPNKPQENYISLIRTVNDLHSQRAIGTVIVNMSENALKKTYESIVSNYSTEVVILDDQNHIAVSTANKLGFDVVEFAAQNGTKDTYWTMWKANNIEYMISYFKIPENGWRIVGIIPLRELSKETSMFSLIAFAVIAGNSILLFIGSMIISRLITVPIKKLLKSMKGIERGEFKRVDIKVGNDEIGKLRDGYNTMIGEIQNLISKIMEEQKMKRKIELDALQAQIKPHFLYNTFDAISSLALSGKNKDVYTIMKALGTYYRTSLSKGREVITIGEEIDVVMNYLKIQKYRYEDMFSVEYDIDEEAKKTKILKLVLQPFAENALYHGIRPKGSSGNIFVAVKRNADCVLLQISDDGVGMSSEEVANLTSGKASRENSSFGIWGTIERLRIFYGVEDIVSIESRKGCGTKVSIRIPLQGE